METGCKPVGSARAGSNPALPIAAIALAVERTLGKGKGVGSNPTGGFGIRLADSQERSRWGSDPAVPSKSSPPRTEM